MRDQTHGRTPDFHFKPTGIGSVPFTDVKDTCLQILRALPEIPFWPQFVKRSPLEDMNIQFSEGLPLLEVALEKRALVLSDSGREDRLVAFYERFLAEDVDYFALGKDYAPGLHHLLHLIEKSPDRYGPFVKGQTVGPVTFAAGIQGSEGKSLLHDPELLEAMVKGIAIKALWQVRELARSGKQAIIFLDEPYLSGFGSAFSPIERDQVIRLIKEVIDYLKERSDTLIGIHCCGNTDWSMILEAGPHILSFDAFEHMDYFLLYPEEITRFLRGGGIIAWGIVPTGPLPPQVSVDQLHGKLRAALERLNGWGLEREILLSSSILTPSCGMGTMPQDRAQQALHLLSTLSVKWRDAF